MMWTPGPWDVTSGFIGPLKIVASVDKSIDRSGKIEVAHVGAETFDRCRANARLISAAPDMAEALQAVVDEYDDYNRGAALRYPDIDWAPEDPDHIKAARSALAKARGET